MTNPPNALERFALDVKRNVEPLLAGRTGMTWPKWEVALRAACMKDSKVMTAVRDNPNAALLAVVKCGQLGLLPDPGLRHFALVPFKGKIEGMVMWRGWLHVAMRSGLVEFVNAEVIYQQELDARDQTKPLRDPLTQVVDHQPDVFGRDNWKDSDIKGAYAVAKLKSGLMVSHVMSLGQILKRKAMGSSGPAWKQWFPEMCMAKAMQGLLNSGKVPLAPEEQQLVRDADETVRAVPVETVRTVPVEPTALPAPPSKRRGAQVLFDELNKNPMPDDDQMRAIVTTAIEAERAFQKTGDEAFAKILAAAGGELDQLSVEELHSVLAAVEGSSGGAEA